MVHNGIEYGIMAAYAEGLNILQQRQRRDAGAAGTTPRPRRCATRSTTSTTSTSPRSPRCGGAAASSRRGCSTSPRDSLSQQPDLADFEGRVSDSGEGRWTMHAAVDEGVPADVLSAALFARFTSRGSADFADRILVAMRKEFGGHDEKLDQTIGEPSRAHGDPSDAFVFFGMSGDLAQQEDLPRALRDGEEGRARRPGDRRRVVDSGRSKTSATARATASPSTAAASTTRPRSSGSPSLLRYVDGDYNDPSTFTELKKTLGDAQRPIALPRDPAEHVRDRGRGARDVGLREERAA